MRNLWLLFASLLVLPAAHAAVCEPKDFHGAYGLSLTGTTNIGSSARPVAVIGRLVVEDFGTLSGISSASFTGLILGNVVTGKYEARTDCSVTWALQDDSGSFQHFAGNMSADGGRVAFRQTDPGGAGNGILLRIVDRCSASSLVGRFQLTLSGSTVDVNTALDSGRVSISGVLIADGARNLSFVSGPDDPERAAGSYEVADDCFAKFVLELPADEHISPPMHFRAIVVESGREVLGIQTDPGTVVGLRLVSK